MKKQKDHAFNKDVYLLGIDSDGIKLWLEEPRWGCGWYWDFGYVETYPHNVSPHNARDIDSHSHFNGLVGKQADGSYKHHINEILKETTLTDKESWELSDYMASFYTLKDAAGVFGRGGSHLSSCRDKEGLVHEDMAKKINEEILPCLFKKNHRVIGTKGVSNHEHI